MNLDETLNQFIAKTGKSKVAVIVPLFGYWSEIQDNFLNRQTLRVTVERLTSSIHNVMIFFVGEEVRIPSDIQNALVTYQARGNVSFVSSESSSFSGYIKEGLDAAHDSSDAAYFIVACPWVLLQPQSIDVMVDRLNYADDAKIVSGYDLRPLMKEEDFDMKAFESLIYNIPKEERALDSNFFGMTRYAMEMSPIDVNIKTSWYMERDLWQNTYNRGFEVITSQRIPIFVFDANIRSIENLSDVESDKLYFQSKWGFLPAL